MAELKIFKVRYHIITPVHIGTGEDLSPFEYVIKDGFLHRIEPDELIADLPENQLQKFYSFIEGNNLIGLRNIVMENFDESRYSKYRIRVTQNIEEKYRQNIKRVENQLLISPFLRTASNLQPYIPGSSIKGAIRTAIIDKILRGKKHKPNLKDKFWEEEVLEAVIQVRRKAAWKTGRQGKFEKGFEEKMEFRPEIRRDPFRSIKVSDVSVSDEFIGVGEVFNVRVNEKRGRLEKIGIQMFKEVLYGEINLNKKVEFEGEIRIDEILNKMDYAGREFRGRWIPMELTKDDIISACNEFYIGEFERERKFFELAIEMHDIIDRIRAFFKLGKDEFILRIGRFSGITAITINKYRKPHNVKWGTTKNLFEGRYPMGWIKVKFLNQKGG
jgi:CRISPR-associated protein Csm5